MSDVARSDRPPSCPMGQHDFGTGKAPCTKCKRTAREVGVEQGVVLKNVTGEPASPMMQAFAIEELNAGTLEANLIMETHRKLVAMGVPGDLAAAMMQRMRGGEGAEASVTTVLSERRLSSGPFDGFMHAIGAREAYDQDYIAPNVWNRADEVAKVYGIERLEGEDDDSLHTRVRRKCSVTPPSAEQIRAVQALGHDWNKAKRDEPAPKREVGTTIEGEIVCEMHSADENLVCQTCGMSLRGLCALEEPRKVN